MEPRPLTRREVFHTAAALGVGTAALSLPTSATAAELAFTKDSGLITGKLKPIKYDEIPGLLSKAQVAPHYNAHYGGALKRYVAIENQLDKLVQGKEPLGGDAYLFMQKDKLNRMNSVLLHELYFDNLVAKPPVPKENIRTAIAKRFGSLERWQEDFKSCATAAAA